MRCILRSLFPLYNLPRGAQVAPRADSYKPPDLPQATTKHHPRHQPSHQPTNQPANLLLFSLLCSSGTILVSFWGPWDPRNIAFSLRGSSLSSISPFSRPVPPKPKKIIQKAPRETSKASKNTPPRTPGAPWSALEPSMETQKSPPERSRSALKPPRSLWE